MMVDPNLGYVPSERLHQAFEQKLRIQKILHTIKIARSLKNENYKSLTGGTLCRGVPPQCLVERMHDRYTPPERAVGKSK